MNRKFLGLLTVAAMAISFSANAQLVSSVVTDSSGLMWANTVGVDVGWNPDGEAGTAQGWVAGLNAENYGGYNDWTLATGDGTAAPNTTTNQLGQLFNTDCGNTAGSFTSLTNPGKNCSALTAIQQKVLDPINLNASVNTLLILSSTPDLPLTEYTGTGHILDYGYWTYSVVGSGPAGFNQDTQYWGVVGLGDALAVRDAPEIDPASAASGLTLLLGGLAVLRGRRKVVAA